MTLRKIASRGRQTDENRSISEDRPPTVGADDTPYADLLDPEALEKDRAQLIIWDMSGQRRPRRLSAAEKTAFAALQERFQSKAAAAATDAERKAASEEFHEASDPYMVEAPSCTAEAFPVACADPGYLLQGLWTRAVDELVAMGVAVKHPKPWCIEIKGGRQEDRRKRNHLAYLLRHIAEARLRGDQLAGDGIGSHGADGLLQRMIRRQDLLSATMHHCTAAALLAARHLPSVRKWAVQVEISERQRLIAEARHAGKDGKAHRERIEGTVTAWSASLKKRPGLSDTARAEEVAVYLGVTGATVKSRLRLAGKLKPPKQRK